MSPKSILITSASGNIGKELIPHLLSTTKNTTLVLPTSNASRLSSSFPAGTDTLRLQIPEGAVSDPVWLESIAKSNAVDTVFLNLGGQDELFDNDSVTDLNFMQTTLGALDAFARAGVKHLIFLSINGEFTSPEGMKTFLGGYSSAAVVVKVAIEQKLWHTKYPFKWTVVGPTLFFENDTRTPHLLQQGIMPEPLGEQGVSRVSCKDLARAVANIAADGGAKLHQRKVNVGSSRRWSGTEIEQLWTKALGKEVKIYKGDDEGLEAYEQSWRDIIPGTAGVAIGRDLALMCRGWVAGGYGMSEDEYRFTRAVLGKDTDDYEAWVAEQGKKLREESK